MYKEWCENASGDWNDYITNGRFMGQGLDNQPPQGTPTTWYIVDVLRHNDKFVVQVAYQFTSASCPVYIRTKNNGSWYDWRLFNPGTANTAQVLSGYTFSSANGVNLSGTMANRGALNWSSSNTTYSVPAGYYSGGTLDSRTSYNNGVTAGKLGSVSYNNASTVMYGVSYSSGNPYNCTKITNGAQYTFNGATGNFLLAIYGFQGLWSHEFGSISVQKVSGSGTLTQRFAVYNRFPTTSGWTGGEAGTTYFILYQVSNANSTNIRITHNQNGRFRLNGAISFLN